MEKLENKRKIFTFNIFHDFIFLVDKNDQNKSFVQISASWNNKYGFDKQTKKNNRKIREQKKNLYFNFFHDFIFLVDREHQITPSE